MSDEEIVREALNLIPAVDYRSEDEDAMHDGLAALSRILSERDSLRTENAYLREGDLGEAREFGDRWRQKANELGAERDSLRAALERAIELVKDWNHPNAEELDRIARQALTSSEKEKG